MCNTLSLWLFLSFSISLCLYFTNTFSPFIPFFLSLILFLSLSLSVFYYNFLSFVLFLSVSILSIFFYLYLFLSLSLSVFYYHFLSFILFLALCLFFDLLLSLSMSLFYHHFLSFVLFLFLCLFFHSFSIYDRISLILSVSFITAYSFSLTLFECSFFLSLSLSVGYLPPGSTIPFRSVLETSVKHFWFSDFSVRETAATPLLSLRNVAPLANLCSLRSDRNSLFCCHPQLLRQSLGWQNQRLLGCDHSRRRWVT